MAERGGERERDQRREEGMKGRQGPVKSVKLRAHGHKVATPFLAK